MKELPLNCLKVELYKKEGGGGGGGALEKVFSFSKQSYILTLSTLMR